MLITFQLPFFHDSIVLASYKDPFPGWVNIKCTNKNRDLVSLHFN